MKFICSLIVVNDINVSKNFYSNLLNQKIEYDFGENVTFEGGFSIHQKSHFASLIRVDPNDIIEKSDNSELYFEEDNLDSFMGTLHSVKLIHAIEEQPWGQRVVRFYDPDMHIVEVGESMKSVARRLLKAGMSIEQTAIRLSMPKEFVSSCSDDLSV